MGPRGRVIPADDLLRAFRESTSVRQALRRLGVNKDTLLRQRMSFALREEYRACAERGRMHRASTKHW